jgi:hypothetical protein
MLIRSFTDISSAVILEYLFSREETHEGSEPTHNKITRVLRGFWRTDRGLPAPRDVIKLTLSFLEPRAPGTIYRAQFIDYWRNTIYGAHTAAEGVLEDVLYLGRGMDETIASIRQQAAATTAAGHTQDLTPTISFHMRCSRIMFAENSFCTLIYPSLIDVCLNPKGRLLLQNLNASLVAAGKCVVVSRTYGTSLATYPRDFAVLQVQLNINDNHLSVMEDHRGLWYLSSLSPDRVFFHECSHLFHFLQNTMKNSSTVTSCRWVNEEEEVTVAEENSYARLQGDLSRISYNSLQRTNLTPFYLALLCGATGTLETLLQESRAKGITVLYNHTQPYAVSAQNIVSNFFTSPLPYSPMCADDLVFLQEIKRNKLKCFARTKKVFYDLKLHSLLFEIKYHEGVFLSRLPPHLTNY